MKCRVCEHNKLSLYYVQGDKGQFRFYKCSNCNLINLDLNDIKISDHQDKYAARYSPIKDYNNEIGAEEAFKFVKKHIPIKGSFLDIGCGSGGVLYFAKKDGWQIRGIEISPDFADFVKKQVRS